MAAFTITLHFDTTPEDWKLLEPIAERVRAMETSHPESTEALAETTRRNYEQATKELLKEAIEALQVKRGGENG